MKKILFACFLVGMGMSTTTTATVFDDNAAFVIAAAVKLGASTNDGSDAVTGPRSVKKSDVRMRTCSRPAGKKLPADRFCANDSGCCDDEICDNSSCKQLCLDGRATDSNKTLCADTGSTPQCVTANHRASCQCISGTADSCPPGMKCNNGTCIGCSGKGQCKCPASQYAHSNTCVNCTKDSDCTDETQVCINAGTINSYCMVKVCEDGKYISNHVCQSCAAAMTGCIQCDVSNVCLECKTGFTLNASKKCVTTSCSAGYFLDEDGHCKTCGIGCATCTSAGLCASCSAGYTLKNGECEPTECTTSGTYLDLRAPSPGCKTCPTGCAECETVVSTDTTASNCTLCKYGYHMEYSSSTQKYSCPALSCSATEFQDEDSCTACSIKISHCTSCTGAYLGPSHIGVTCKTCESGYTLANNSNNNPGIPKVCVLSDCTTRISNCKSCSLDVGNVVTCLSCMDGYAVANNRTACSQCSANTYSSNGLTCEACPSNGYSKPGSSKCTICDGDNEIVNAGRTACALCPEGQAPNSGHTSCVAIANYCSSNSDCGNDGTKKCHNNKCVLRSCAEIGQAKGKIFGTQALICDAGYQKKTNTYTGNDGQCYECEKRSDYCNTTADCNNITLKCENNACVLRTCAEIGKANGSLVYGLSSMTCVNAGYELAASGHTGKDGKCYYCKTKSGYCDDTKPCSSSQKCVNHICTAKVCADYGYINAAGRATCTAGLYGKSTGVSGSDGACYECTKCDVGTEPNSGHTACSACADGKVNNKKGGACEICGTGTYAVEKRYCQVCPSGSYCVNGIKYACASGKTSATGSSSASDCKSCTDLGYKGSANECTGYGTGVDTAIGTCYACHACSEIKVGRGTAIGTCTACTKAGLCTAVSCSSGIVVTSGSEKYCDSCPAFGICSNGSFTGCQTGYFKNGSSCLQCSLTGCTTCKQNVATPTCTACTAGYFLSNGACTLCNAACKTCTRIDQCTECVNGNTPPFCGGTHL